MARQGHGAGAAAGDAAAGEHWRRRPPRWRCQDSSRSGRAGAISAAHVYATLMTCHACYDPSRVAGPSASRARPGCSCLLPVSCSAPRMLCFFCKYFLVSGMACQHPLTTNVLRGVGRPCQKRKKYLQKGTAHEDLPSAHDCFARASRHDHSVAHVRSGARAD